MHGSCRRPRKGRIDPVVLTLIASGYMSAADSAAVLGKGCRLDAWGTRVRECSVAISLANESITHSIYGALSEVGRKLQLLGLPRHFAEEECSWEQLSNAEQSDAERDSIINLEREL